MHLQNGGIIARSIPACAGEAQSATTAGHSYKVYPRVCGGSLQRKLLRPVRGGLSPRVRGKPGCKPARRPGRGSIPACAGEAFAHLGSDAIQPVYPRVCGGSAVVAPPPGPMAGLSPRVRGKRASARLSAPATGSIPACAGEAMAIPPFTKSWRVYPRVCGGSGIGVSWWTDNPGLSPRVRGKLVPVIPVVFLRRSIPACAGEATTIPAGWPPTRVYPRVCGGSANTIRARANTQGLSPRVRGKPRHQRQ